MGSISPFFFGVTIDLQVRYKKPVLLGMELQAIGRITTRLLQKKPEEIPSIREEFRSRL